MAHTHRRGVEADIRHSLEYELEDGRFAPEFHATENSLTGDAMNDRNRMQFFSNALLLRSLCDPDAPEELGKIRDAFAPPKNFRLLMGYKSVIEAVLYSQLNLLVLSPGILRLEWDDPLAQWWANTESKSYRGFNVLAGNAESRVSLIANHINGLLGLMVRSPKWEDFCEACAGVNSFANAILSVARQCRIEYSRLDSKNVVELTTSRSCLPDWRVP